MECQIQTVVGAALEPVVNEMDVIYKFRADASYYRTLINRYYQQRPLPFRLTTQFGLVALVFAAGMIWGLVAPLGYKVAVALPMGALILFGGVALTKWAVYQRMRGRSDFGRETTVTMSDSGFVGRGAQSEGKWSWTDYPKAVRFSDGIMLLRRGVIRWLPDSGIVVGTPTDATALARSKSALRELG
jgi:hypothetical protein